MSKNTVSVIKTYRKFAALSEQSSSEYQCDSAYKHNKNASPVAGLYMHFGSNAYCSLLETLLNLKPLDILVMDKARLAAHSLKFNYNWISV